MSQVRKAVIIGAGPAGILAALRLQQFNHISPIIYEIRPEPTTLGGAIGIPSNGLRLLYKLGLWDALRDRGAETSTVSVHAIKGHVIGNMDMASWSREKTGFGYLRIRRVDLMEVLYDEARKAGIPICFSKHLTGIEEDNQGITVTFSDGTSDKADLLLGCDGIHSMVRTLYVDPNTEPEYSGISNIYSLVATSELPSAAASIDSLNVMLTTDGLLAISPCRASREMVYWFFSRELAIPPSGDTRDGWEERGKQQVETIKSTVLDLIKDSEGEWGLTMKETVRQTNTLRFYPIYHLPAGGKWSKGRCLVIGDAAHAMQPHASQGVSMALEDIFMLSNLLDSNPASLNEVFRIYEQKRRPRVNEMHQLAERNGGVRKRISPWQLWLKEIATSGALGIYSLFGLSKLGIGQKPLAYDIEEDMH
ncbi:FAD binding domain protein [Talaromyces proteolyticus]|uniref:FAD binding domain protein n=1 Tax=Talaromyces proteolyticus TaxID=1131652 RepID=A0AAD4KWK5_9EURO|nr:FAD binding domain protein [Talaromyces proteolyticus]KAH8702508.1 FAD binding domain protein [Talaromyces proteolyticus]